MSGGTSSADDTVHVQIVLDRSGSMEPIAAATVDGLNGFLAKQRKVPGALRLSLADFDSQEPFRIVADAIPVAEMLDLTDADFQPRGGTPLFDAIGRAIERCDARAGEFPDEDQVLVIITDGAENASTDFNGPKVAALLEARQEAGWSVLFLGANQDAFDTGASLHMRAGNVRNFIADEHGVASAMNLAAEAVSHHRSMSRTERSAAKDMLFDEADGAGAGNESPEHEGTDRPSSAPGTPLR